LLHARVFAEVGGDPPAGLMASHSSSRWRSAGMGERFKGKISI
jgi:hypothetical protein